MQENSKEAKSKIEKELNSELNKNNTEPAIQEISSQDKFLETLIEKGGQVLMGYTQMNQET